MRGTGQEGVARQLPRALTCMTMRSNCGGAGIVLSRLPPVLST